MDPEQTQQILEQIKDGFLQVKENIESITDKMAIIPTLISGATGNFTKLTEATKTADTQLQNTVDKVKLFGNLIATLSPSARHFFDALTAGSRESADSIGDIHGALLAATGAIGSFLPTSGVFNNIGKEATMAGKMVDQNFVSIFQKLGMSVPISMLKHAESAREAETSLAQLHARAGTLLSTFNTMGTDMTTLNSLTDEFADRMMYVGNATGMLSTEVTKYSEKLLQIPGAYNKIISDTPAGSMDLLSAAITVARGTTQDFNDVFDIMNMQFKNFGQVGSKPLELMSRMFSVSQSLGLPLNYITNQIKSVSDQFKFFGDNTEAAIRVFQGFAPALRASGVGPEGLQQIIGNLTQAVGKLDIAQKAFISAQTGGAGGLQGAFQIDLLMQQGKMDEVMRRMQQSLTQQFGKIVTLQQAAQDPEAAQQMMRQVAFLRQGPLGQLAQTDAEAYKLIEAMQKGATPAIERTEEGNLVLQDTMRRGNQMQERQNSHLVVMSNALTRISAAVDNINNKAFREVAGVGTIEKPGMAAEELRATAKNATIMAAQEKPIIRTPEQAVLNIGLDLKETSTKMFQGFKNLIQENVESRPEQNLPQDPGTRINIPNVPENQQPSKRSLPAIDPNESARFQRTSLLENNKTAEANLAANMSPRNDVLTIMIKNELPDRIEERVVAKITANTITKVEQISQDKAISGFSVNTG